MTWKKASIIVKLSFLESARLAGKAKNVMKILGFDSSGLVASVAIVEDNDLKWRIYR